MTQTNLLQIPSTGIAGSTSAQPYTQYSFTYTATGPTTYINFEFQQDPRFFALDTISFTDSSGTQLLQNGGFELGTYAGWTNFWQPNVSAGGVVSAGTVGTTTSGTQAGSYYWMDGSVGGVDGLAQGVPTTAGQTYTLSFWLANDGGGPAVFRAIVGDSPALSLSISGTVANQATTDAAPLTPFNQVSIADSLSGQTETVTVAPSNAANGSLSDPNAATTGGTFSNGVYQVTGTPAQVTTALRGLLYTPASNRVAAGQAVSTAFTITSVNTAGNTARNVTTSVAATAVNNAPVLGGTVAGQAATSGVALNPFAAVVVSDPDVGAAEAVTITLRDGNGAATDANGSLSGTGLSRTGAGTYALAAGTPAAVQAALRALRFTPTANQAPPGTTVTTALTLSVSDGTAPAVVDGATTVVAGNRYPAVVTGITASPADALLGVGGQATLTVAFSRSVVVGGTGLVLALNDGGTAAYASGSGTSALSFLYTAAAGQDIGDLAATGLVLNGATVRDVDGNDATLSGAAANPPGTLVVDTTPPLVTLALSNDAGASATDGVTNSAALAGTADANGTVTVLDGVTVLGSTTADAQGRWSYTPTPADGHHTLTARQTDLAGNTGAATLSFTLDRTAPTVTGVTASPSGATLGVGATVVLTVGLSEPVLVAQPGSALPTLTLDSGGTATYSGPTSGGTALSALTFGYTVQAGQNTPDLTVTGFATGGTVLADAAGNLLALPTRAVNPFGTLAIDTTAPVVTARLANDTGASAADGVTSDPTLTGTAEPGGTVAVLDGAVTLGTAPVGTDGTWSFTPTLSDGTYALTASETDQAGNVGISAAVRYTLDTAVSPAVAAADDAAGALTHRRVTGNVLANDSAPNGAALRVTSVRFAGGATFAVPSSGAVTVPANGGQLTIDTAGNFAFAGEAAPGGGALPFTYTVEDGNGQAAAARLVIQVTDAAPEAQLSFGFALASTTVEFRQGQALLTGPDGSVTDVTGVGTLSFTDGTVQERDGSLLVDDLYYYARNPDVWAAHVDADQHYAQFGWREGRDPNALFSTGAYLAANPDVAQVGVDPLQHYAESGWREGRAGVPGFSAEAYRAANPDVAQAGSDPLAHYLASGQAEGRYAFAGLDAQGLVGAFDPQFYLSHNPDVAAAVPAGRSHQSFALEHYLTYGWKEGRDPDAAFSTSRYLAANPDVVQGGMNPLLHYEQYGWREGRDSGPDFHATAYLDRNADVAAARVDPLQHYLEYGIAEGRQPE